MNEPTISTPPRLTHRTKAYKPEHGDEFVTVDAITAADRGRIFEARFEDGTGRLGLLRDAEHYMLNDVVLIRFEGQKLAAIGTPDKRDAFPAILRKPLGFQMPEAVEG